MTQNVKKRRSPWSSARSLAALFLVALAGALTVSGCNSDSPEQSCKGNDCTASGRFTPCNQDAECDQAHGFSCVEGECSYECQSHADCTEVGHCDTREVDGARRSFCVRDEQPPKAGELYTRCPLGTECSEGALCIGAGAGDLDAYCTIDCGSDDDCAAGYTCGTVVRSPCTAACGFKGVPADPRCVPADQIGDGKPYQCGTQGVERSVCRQREFCSPCDTDADCLAVPNQICARDGSGEKICTRLCDPGTRSCPWGNASECGNFDKDVGAPTCAHRFGSCHGTGQTCQPCRGNADCPGGGCTSSSFTGERWCINFDTQCSCKKVDATGTCNDGGCPDSPGGLPIQCVGTEDSSLFNICYAANSGTQSLLGSSSQTGCWAAN